MRLLQIILGSKWKRFAWRIPEAQGSDLSVNLFGRKRRGHEGFGILQMFVVVIDRDLKLA
jgi:hypothetical protein